MIPDETDAIYNLATLVIRFSVSAPMIVMSAAASFTPFTGTPAMITRTDCGQLPHSLEPLSHAQLALLHRSLTKDTVGDRLPTFWNWNSSHGHLPSLNCTLAW